MPLNGGNAEGAFQATEYSGEDGSYATSDAGGTVSRYERVERLADFAKL